MDECRHQVLSFQDGGFHLVCNGCQKKYVACIPGFDIPDIMSRRGSLCSLDLRTDPLSVNNEPVPAFRQLSRSPAIA